MYYYSKKSSRKIVHTESCAYKNHLAPEDIGTFDTLQQAYEKGYRLCKICHPVKKQYRKEETEILDYCRRHGMICSSCKKGIHVSSTISTWIITATDNGKTELYHRNTKKLAKDGMSIIPGYHQQYKSFDSIIDYLAYIEDHDFYRQIHPEVMPRKAKVKAPPKKGTRRYRNQMKKQKRVQRSQAISSVLLLINSLDSNFAVHPAVCQ